MTQPSVGEVHDIDWIVRSAGRPTTCGVDGGRSSLGGAVVDERVVGDECVVGDAAVVGDDVFGTVVTGTSDVAGKEPGTPLIWR